MLITLMNKIKNLTDLVAKSFYSYAQWPKEQICSDVCKSMNFIHVPVLFNKYYIKSGSGAFRVCDIIDRMSGGVSDPDTFKSKHENYLLKSACWFIICFTYEEKLAFILPEECTMCWCV